MKAVSGRDEVAKPRLADGVIQKIKSDILSGTLALGSQLPTEPGLMEQFEVSRTVVREALAELRAVGLVTPVQGKGVFVSDRVPQELAALSSGELQSIPRMIDRLEFRTAIEIESAAMAAQRRTRAQEYDILDKQWKFREALEGGEKTSEEDFAFHMAIAQSTHNDFFVDALLKFGSAVIPRASLPNLSELRSKDYLELILGEHEKIAQAISDQDQDAAREAMREHLGNSQTRYRNLARATLKSNADTD